MTTQRGEEPAVLRTEEDWFAQPVPRTPADDLTAAPGIAAVHAVVAGDGTPAGEPLDDRAVDGLRAARAARREFDPTETRAFRPDEVRAALNEEPAVFDPSDTGTWRVRSVVPGADGGRRNTTILRYLLGLLAVDHLRSLTRWAYVVPVVGLILLVVKPRWIGLAVFVLGVLFVIGRSVAAKMIARRTLARRYRPLEDDLRAATEAGKANLRGELDRVGLPSGRLSVLKLARGTDRSAARSKLREVEIHRILPEAQLQRALKVLDEAAPPAR